MGLPLFLPTPLVRRRVIALVRLATGAEVRQPVVVEYAAGVFAKSGTVYHDADGSFRWITLKPNGDDSKGTPVKIRESKTQKGVWHVVAGAGGRLSYLKLHLGTVDEQRARADAKKEAKQLRAKNQRELEHERKAGLSDEERKAEAERSREQKRQQQAGHDEVRTRQQEQIAAVAQHLGWDDDEWKFDATRDRLKASGASAERIKQQEAAHLKRVYQRVEDALAQTKRQLLAERATASGTVPLTTTDPETVALTDLLATPATPKGKGYQSITKQSSDAEIRAALASTDAEALAAELRDAQAAIAGDPTGNPEGAAKIADLRAQLHTAALLARAETMTPADIEARRQAVSTALAAAQTNQDGYRPRLTALRDKLRATDGKGLDGDETAELEHLELQLAEDLRHVERLKGETLDLAVMAGETIKPAVAGEQKRVAAANQVAREEAIRREHGEPGVTSYRAMREKLTAGRERYQHEMEHFRATGALRRPELAAKPIADAEVALQLLAKQKAITKMERQLAGDADDLDLRMFGKGYFDAVGQATPEMIAEVERDFTNSVREQQTRAFLSRADSPELLLGRGGRYSDDVDARTLHQALERHLSAGAYHALNNAALAGVKAPILSRDVVDTLGAPAAAQLLAHTLAQSESPATLKAMAKGLGAYHVAQHVEQAEERLREVEEALDQADEAIAHLTDPADVGVALEANQRRQAKLEEARQTLGQSLGEYEATAALVQALGQGPPTKLEANLGPVGTETAIRQLRALGLDRADYAITSDGTNYFATIQPSGFAKLAAPVDRARVQLQDEVMAIKRGERDEPDWTPPGTVVRQATTFTAPGKEPPPLRVTPLGDSLRALGQGSMFGGGGSADVAGAVQSHLAHRAANGEDPNTMLADLHARMLEVPGEHRQAVAAEINRVFPLMQPLVERGKPVYRTGADGKMLHGEDGQPIPKLVPTKAETHAAALRQLTRDVFAKEGLDRSADLHSQTVDLHHPKTREALTRALAEDPRALVAFKAPGELTHQDQRALRHAFATDIAKQDDPGTGLDKAALDAKIAALGPAPAPQKDLFTGTETPTEEGLAWKRQRDALVAEAQQGPGGEATPSAGTTSWNDYVAVMGGTRQAYQALQDHLKSRALKRFHQAYTVLHDQPLRIGTRSIAHAERHAGYLDPGKRAAMLAAHAKLVDEARNRVAGQYAAGSATEKLGRLAQADEIVRQNQMGLLGASPAATTRKQPDPHERYTLGETIEGQLASLMPEMARAFDPAKPVPLLKDLAWSPQQQRAIKIGLASKRTAQALGVGSGKTAIAVGMLTQARADPKSGVKRALYLVPSAVAGQFGAEFTRLVEPGSLTWAANLGADRTQRLAEHADASTHAVVHTHEAARDDFLHLLGQHWGLEGAAARDKLMSLDRKGAATEMKAALAKASINYQMLVTDEAHKLLDRTSKPDSVLSRVIQALGDNTPFYQSLSADPIKNDVSELRSLLDKLHPDGRYSDAGAWQRRYGVNTTASAEALKREIAPSVYAASVPTGNQVTRRREVVPMHPKQAGRYAAAMGAFEKLRSARARGIVDVEAAKVLAPDRFATTPEAEHQALAREIQKNPGALKEEALRRIVDEAPRHENAKIQKLLELVKEHPTRDKPVVVFAHRLKAVDEITEALAEQGHRVQQLTGADSADVRDAKRRRFQEQKDVDVFVLSDAGEAGLNLQRGSRLFQYDAPLTAKTQEQRNGRIDRRGREDPDVELVNLATDSPFDARALTRLQTKGELRQIVTDPSEMIDETGVAKVFGDARRQAASDAAMRGAA